MEQIYLDSIINNYALNHDKYGYGSRSLEMPSDRRNIRYYELIKNFPIFENKNNCFTILDVGCGYGDLLVYLDYLGFKNFKYIGIDLCNPFIDYAKSKYANRGDAEFILSNFFEQDFDDIIFDYAVFSQTFNNKYSECDNNEDLIKSVINKVFLKAKKGVSFNFVTNKVQYKKENVAYHSVEDLLTFVYSLSNCIILDNSCMPYEATLSILKDKSSDGLVYDSFRFKHCKEFNEGSFVIIKKDMK